MAFSDYKFVGYEDEKMITELILSNLSVICKAREDRVSWLESLALSLGQDLSSSPVDGTRLMSKNEKYIEQIECDKVSQWLFKIESRVMYRIKCLPKRERDIIREYYLVPGPHSLADVGRRLGMSPAVASVTKNRAILKLTGVCVDVYRDFCNWRAHDAVDLNRRLAEDENTIKKKLLKKEESRKF